ncbi:MAG TPA: hypothetical protein ENO21_03865, partial [Firmicutes bacterium]|nr:hypothetical protein [Bacillota bacterium]
TYRVLTGPTAAGKTGLLLEAAPAGGLLVISADSRQVYRYMDVGTGKSSASEQAVLPHRVIDVVDPGDEFSAYEFVRHAAQALNEARDSGVAPWVCGGTGLYIRALVERLAFGAAPRPRLRDAIASALGSVEPRELAARLQLELAEPDNPVRVMRAAENAAASEQARQHIYRAVQLDTAEMDADASEARGHRLPGMVLDELARWDCAGVYLLNPGTAELDQRIRRRVLAMFSNGLLTEVKRLREMGLGKADVVLNGIAYREAGAVIDGEMTSEEAVERAAIRTRQYAKRQRTYARGRGWQASEPAEISRAVAASLGQVG